MADPKDVGIASSQTSSPAGGHSHHIDDDVTVAALPAGTLDPVYEAKAIGRLTERKIEKL